MNLIEKLGLEKCKQIVEGAPSDATTVRLFQNRDQFLYGRCHHNAGGNILLISDLRTAIDHHYYGQSEQKELEQYAVLSQEKIEGGAVLVGDNSKVVQMVRGITDTRTDIKNHISPNTKVIEG